MKLMISEEEFLNIFGDRNSSEFEVSWQLSINRAVWCDAVYGETYVVSYE